MQKWSLRVFLGLVFLSLLTPFVVFYPLLFPFITSKAFLFRGLIELALPFYCFLVIVQPALRPRLKNPLTLSLLAFLFLSILTSFTGVNFMRSMWGNFERMGGSFYLAHLVLLYFYLLLLAKADEVYLKRFLQALLIAAVLLTLNGLSGKLGFRELTLDLSLPERVSSTFGNPIFFASFLVLPFSLFLYFFIQTQIRFQKILYALGALLILWGIYASGTRGAMVGLVVAIFVSLCVYWYLSRQEKTKIRKWSLLAATLLLILAGLGFIYAKRLPANFALSRVFVLNDSNTQARLIQWKMALQGFKERPFLGFGPENYYLVANKYHNPQINQYDMSWFDKPHNYYLEILVTTGVFGFLAYLAVIIFVFWGLIKAYRSQMLLPGETAVLIGGFVVYLIQNAFVFDTVSPSLTFFIFCGLAGYFYESWLPQTAQKRVMQKSLWAYVGFTGTGILALGLLFYTNWLPVLAARNINYGYASSASAPHLSAEFFQKARDNNFNFDPSAAAGRNSEVLDGLIQSSLTEKEPGFVVEQIDQVTAFTQTVTQKIQNDPYLWIRLGSDKILQALVHGQPLDQKIEEPIQKAIALAPKRTEPWSALFRFRGFQKDWPGAAAAAQKLVELNPYFPGPKAQLALAFHQAGNLPEAASALAQALDQGYRFQTTQEFFWVIGYYQEQKDYASVAKWYEQAVILEPTNEQFFINMAEAYAQAGDANKARAIFQTLIQQDPARSKTFQAEIDKLPKS